MPEKSVDDPTVSSFVPAYRRAFTKTLDVFYGRLGYTLAVICLLGAAGFSVLAVSDDPDWWIGAAVLAGYAIAVWFATNSWRRVMRIRASRASEPRDLLGERLVSFDYLDARTLSDLAAQANILPSPRRKERGRSSKQGWTVGAKKVVEAGVSREAAEQETDVFELPENPTVLLRKLLMTLSRRGDIRADLAHIPNIAVDARVDPAEIAVVLEGGLDRETFARLLSDQMERSYAKLPDPEAARAANKALADVVTKVLSERLPTERLLRAKTDEFAGISENQFIFLEMSCEWSVERVDVNGSTEVRLRLSKLHEIDADGNAVRTVDMPDGVNLSLALKESELQPRTRLRFGRDHVKAGVFGQVLFLEARNALVVWPIAVIS